MGTCLRQADTVVKRNLPGFLRLRLTQSESLTCDLNSDSALAFPNWTEATGLHGERDGIPRTADYWSRRLSVVLYKQGVHSTCSPMLCVKCSVRASVVGLRPTFDTKAPYRVFKLHKIRNHGEEIPRK